MTTVSLKAGDTKPLRVKINTDLTGQLVFFSMSRRGTGVVVIDEKPCSIVEAATGEVSYAWLASETATPGSYRGEFKILDQAEIATAPAHGALDIEIEADIGTATLAALSFAPPTLEVQTERSAAVQVFRTSNGGSPVDVTSQVAWSGPLDPPLVEFDTPGEATGLNAGAGEVVATVDGLSASLGVTVTPAPPSFGLRVWFSSANVDGLGNQGLANGDFVGTWKNLGTGGIDAVAPSPDFYSPALKVLSPEAPQLQFDGVQDRMDMAGSTALLGFIHRGIYDIIIVARRRTVGIDNQPLGSTATTAESGIYVAFTALDGSVQVVLSKSTPGTPVVSHASTVNAQLGAPEKYLLRGDGSFSRIAKADWSSFQSQAFTSAPGIGDATNDFRIGGILPGPTSGEGGGGFFDGDLFEVLIYDRNLTSAELAQVQAYILATVGI